MLQRNFQRLGVAWNGFYNVTRENDYLSWKRSFRGSETIAPATQKQGSHSSLPPLWVGANATPVPDIGRGLEPSPQNHGVCNSNPPFIDSLHLVGDFVASQVWTTKRCGLWETRPCSQHSRPSDSAERRPPACLDAETRGRLMVIHLATKIKILASKNGECVINIDKWYQQTPPNSPTMYHDFSGVLHFYLFGGG